MNFSAVRVLIVTVVIGCLVGWPRVGLAQPHESTVRTAEHPVDEDDEDLEFLGEYLYVMTKKLGCQYTIEDAPPPGEPFPWLVLQTLPSYDTDLKSIDELVTYINTNFNSIRAVRNTSFPSVVHLTSWHILDEDYLVDRIIEVPPYKGPVDDFGDHLGTVTDGHVMTRSFYSMPVPEVRDLTDVETKSERGVLREILTCVAIKEPERQLLWEVRSFGFKKDSRIQAIEVFYPGTRPK